MFGLGQDQWAQSKQLFADQFEPDGEGFLYRRSQKGPPIRVTAAERERFETEYAKRLRSGTWAIVIGVLLVTGVSIWWSVSKNLDVPDSTLYAGIGTVAAVAIGYTLWVWGAPARELARRTPVGRERSRAEMRRRMLQNLSYGQLASAAFASAILPFTFRGDQDVFSGWSRLWLVLSGLLVLLAGVQAFRKWRFDRQNEDR